MLKGGCKASFSKTGFHANLIFRFECRHLRLPLAVGFRSGSMFFGTRYSSISDSEGSSLKKVAFLVLVPALICTVAIYLPNRQFMKGDPVMKGDPQTNGRIQNHFFQ